MQKAVKYILSDEYKEVEPEEPKPVEKDTVPTYKKQRYSSDYSRFENDEFTKPLQKKKWNTTPEDFIPEKPTDGNPKQLAAHLMIKESIAYKEKGNEAFKKQKWSEAEDLYTSGVTLNPSNISLYNNRSQARINLKKYELALEDCHKVLSSDSINGKALKRKATCLVNLRRSAEAILTCDEVIRNEGRTKDILEIRKKALSQVDDEQHVTDYLTDDLRHRLEEALNKLDQSLSTFQTAEQESQQCPDKPPASNNLSDVADSCKAISSIFQEKDLTPDVRKAMLLICSWRPVSVSHALLQLVDSAHKYLQEDDTLRDIVVVCIADVCYEQSDEGGDFTKLIRLLTTDKNDKHVAKPSHQSLAALVTMTGASDRFRVQLLEQFGTKRLLDLPKAMSTDGQLEVLIQLLDNIMHSSEWCEALYNSGHSMPSYILPMLQSTKTRGLQSAATACIMRLTTDTRFRKLLSTSHLSSIVNCFVKETEFLNTPNCSYFGQEAILSVLYNCLTDGAAATLSVLSSEKVINCCLTLLSDSSKRFLASDASADASTDAEDATPVLTRSLSFLSKVIKVPQVHGIVKRDQIVKSTLLPVLYRSFTVCKKDVQGGSYEMTLDENIISILASLINAEQNPSQTLEIDALTDFISTTQPTEQILLSEPTKFLKVMYKFLAEGTNRLTGNVALMVSNFAGIPKWIELLTSTKEGIICPLLDVIKRKRSERRIDDTEAALNISAQKNAAIALAKLAKQPKLLEELRAHQGFDIISTTLKYVEQQNKQTEFVVEAATSTKESALTIAG
eukprot:TRINITY_DN31178_c0_g1_i1.p1 TRINITY_DN31178_c0_g1~~TRINITY_DN31178_c0_g1_i1.p1  ORF type:complete len:835 (+),score=168.93 TRINITY_DN31178_c0_g1_i1:136-2505(+)